MSAIETNKAIVRRYLEAVEAGDADTCDTLHARDATWWVLGGGEMSREVFIAAVREMVASSSYRLVTIRSMIAEDDKVAVEIESEMHFGAHVYRNLYHDLFVIGDGLIVHGREYLDTKIVAEFQTLLGV
jgi:ketosteroid isomerase-like protein